MNLFISTLNKFINSQKKKGIILDNHRKLNKLFDPYMCKLFFIFILYDIKNSDFMSYK
jgi:hypothetical protein